MTHMQRFGKAILEPYGGQSYGLPQEIALSFSWRGADGKCAAEMVKYTAKV